MKSILTFVLFAALMCWLMFAPVYKHVLITRQALLQKEVDYLLEVGANGEHGYIHRAMVNDSKQRLSERGFVPSDLEYTVTTTTGASGTNDSRPELRGTGIGLKITYPYKNLFIIDGLIGMSPVDGLSRMGASGMKMSEYVP